MRALSWIGLAVVARAFCPSGLAARPALRARAPLRAGDGDGAARDDDDAPIDLGDDFDWRKARAALVSAEKGGAGGAGGGAGGAGGAGAAPARVVVSEKNEALLERQSPALASEYRGGAWAHRLPGPEVGALVLRLPVAATLAETLDASPWGYELGRRLMRELDAAFPSAGAQALAPERRVALYAERAAQLERVYRAAEFMLKDEIAKLGGGGGGDDGGGGGGGAVGTAEDAAELIGLVVAEQKEWQSTMLVLEHDASPGGAAESVGVVINRPLATSVNAQLARLMLARDGAPPAAPERGGDEATAEVERLLVDAFGRDGVVYFGGDERQLDGGLVLHAGGELGGATPEVGAGTGLYAGRGAAALEAVARAVKAGELEPLDVRLFVGRCVWPRGELAARCAPARAEYRAVAAARALVLKQCVGLPKPLWHEIMQLAGGRDAEISRLEIAHRTDLDESERSQ